MFAELVDALISGIHSVVTYGLFAPIVSFAIKIAAIYLGVWLIYGGMQIAAGKKPIRDLGWGIGKFIFLFLLLFSVGIVGSISGYVLSNLEAPKKLAGSLDSMISGFDVSLSEMSQYWSGVLPVDALSNVRVDPNKLKGIQDARKRKIEEEYETVKAQAQALWEFSKDKCVELKSDECIEKAKNKREKTLDAAEQARKAALLGDDTELNNLKRSTKVDSEATIAEINQKAADAEADRDVLDSIDNGITNIGKMPFLLVAAISAFFAMMFLFPLIFKILELVINLVITVCFIAAAVPLAGMALVYGKWFKNIFDKWFGMFVHNIISLPIIVMIFGGLMSVVTISLSSPFGAKVGFGNFAEVIHGAIISGDISNPSWTMKAGCLCVLFIGPKLVSMMIDATTKFLDELLGGSLSSQSNGAISQLGSVAGTAGAGAMSVGLAKGLGATPRAVIGAAKKGVGMARGGLRNAVDFFGGVKQSHSGGNMSINSSGATKMGSRAYLGMQGVGNKLSNAMNKLRN